MFSHSVTYKEMVDVILTSIAIRVRVIVYMMQNEATFITHTFNHQGNFFPA